MTKTKEIRKKKTDKLDHRKKFLNKEKKNLCYSKKKKTIKSKIANQKRTSVRLHKINKNMYIKNTNIFIFCLLE